jgi:glycosyltransferase involved in cell wall biosynthesis
MESPKPSTVVDQRWACRKAIVRRIPLPVRRWIMSRYHWFFRYFDQVKDFFHQAITWRGQKPRVFFPSHLAGAHAGAWQMYATYPPLRFAPQPIAELCHWINLIPEHPTQPCVAECEHVLAIAGAITNWQVGLTSLDRINRLIAQPQCKFVFTYSQGLVVHSQRYVTPDLWHKLGHIYQAFPSQPEYTPPPPTPFNILLIASRFSDKGVPEAIEAFRALRTRHGAEVQLSLVCHVIPTNYNLPEGVVIYDTPRLSPALKTKVYQAAHVLFIPCYSDGATCFVEACAFGVPILSTRIHHGEEFVQNSVTGYLVDPPVYSYSEHYGTRWKYWEDFLADLDRIRERGELQTVVDQSLDRLEKMYADRTKLTAMGQAARALHAECFSPEVRNRKLLQVYQAAIDQVANFPQ